MLKFFLIVLSLHASAKTHRKVSSVTDDANCGSVDLRSRLIQPLQQGSTNWCFAYTAAALASFKLNVAVSAADIAVNYTDTEADSAKRAQKPSGEQDYNKDGGTPKKALDRSAALGFCREEQFSSENRANGIKAYEDALQAEADLREKQRLGTLPRGQNPDTVAAHPSTETVFPKAAFYDELVTRDGAKKSDVIREMRKTACKDRIIASPAFQVFEDRCDASTKCSKGQSDRQKKMIASIDEQLSRSNIVGMSFSPKTYFPLIGGQHAATIVGRKIDRDGDCRYIIRDSESARFCPILVEAQETGAASRNGPDCVNGHIEVRRQDLQKFILGVTYIQ